MAFNMLQAPTISQRYGRGDFASPARGNPAAPNWMRGSLAAVPNSVAASATGGSPARSMSTPVATHRPVPSNFPPPGSRLGGHTPAPSLQSQGVISPRRSPKRRALQDATARYQTNIKQPSSRSFEKPISQSIDMQSQNQNQSQCVTPSATPQGYPTFQSAYDTKGIQPSISAPSKGIRSNQTMSLLEARTPTTSTPSIIRQQTTQLNAPSNSVAAAAHIAVLNGTGSGGMFLVF